MSSPAPESGAPHSDAPESFAPEASVLQPCTQEQGAQEQGVLPPCAQEPVPTAEPNRLWEQHATTGEWPEVADLLRIPNQREWLWAFLNCWIGSRDYPRLRHGLPCVVVALAAVAAVFWLKYAADTPVLEACEQGLQAAIRNQDPDRQEVCLKALVALRPSDPGYQLQLGTLLLERGRSEGLGLLTKLTPEQTDGYLPAHLWLAEQARRPTPCVRLTPAQQEGHLLKVVRQDPDHLKARLLLAQICADRADWKLAEDHLSTIVIAHPEHGILLAKIKKTLRRPASDIDELLRRSATTFSERLQLSPKDPAIRTALAEALLLQGQQQQARQLLVSGLELQDDPRLRRALSDFDLADATAQLAESPLNRDAAAALVRTALSTDPTNPSLITELTRLTGIGIKLEPAALAPAIAHWQQASEAAPGDARTRILFGQLQTLAGDHAGAVATIQPLRQAHPQLRLPLAQQLALSGRRDEAAALFAELLAEQRSALEAAPDNPQARGQLAETLMAAGQPQDALECLRDPEAEQDFPQAASPALRGLLGQVCLMLYDGQIPPDQPIPVNAQSTEADIRKLLQLLQGGLASGIHALPAVDRLARLAYSKHPAADSAMELMGQLRASGDPGGQIVLALGSQAILAKDYARAVTWLEQANQQTRGRNPLILNNLAVALVRRAPGDPRRALDLVDQALTLLPEHPDLLSTRGEVLVALERWAEAVADLNRALPQRSDSVLVHQLLERCYTSLGDTQMARQHADSQQRLQSAED